MSTATISAVEAFARAAVHGGRQRARQSEPALRAVRDGIRYKPYVRMRSPRATGLPVCLLPAMATASARRRSMPRRAGSTASGGSASPTSCSCLTTEKLRQRTAFGPVHLAGFTEVFVDGAWRRATPTFSDTLCAKLGVTPLDFDGHSDALLHPLAGGGRAYMQYVNDHGTYRGVHAKFLMREMARDPPVRSRRRRRPSRRRRSPRSTPIDPTGVLTLEIHLRRLGRLLSRRQASGPRRRDLRRLLRQELYAFLNSGGSSAFALLRLGRCSAATPPAPHLDTPVPAGGCLVNLSTRAEVDATRGLIAGFVLSDLGTKRFLARAVGPGLPPFGVTSPLADPRLSSVVMTAMSRAVTAATTNDNWDDADNGSPRRHRRHSSRRVSPRRLSRDAAVLATIASAPHSALVSGPSGTTGTALVELYDLDSEQSPRLANLSIPRPRQHRRQRPHPRLRHRRHRSAPAS